MINSVNVPEKLYNLLSDDLQYNLKLVSNYCNIDSNQIMYDIDEIFESCVKGIQTSSIFSFIFDSQISYSILNFNKVASQFDIMFLSREYAYVYDDLSNHKKIKEESIIILSRPYTAICVLKYNQQFLPTPPIKFLLR